MLFVRAVPGCRFGAQTPQPPKPTAQPAIGRDPEGNLRSRLLAEAVERLESTPKPDRKTLDTIASQLEHHLHEPDQVAKLGFTSGKLPRVSAIGDSIFVIVPARLVKRVTQHIQSLQDNPRAPLNYSGAPVTVAPVRTYRPARD